MTEIHEQTNDQYEKYRQVTVAERRLIAAACAYVDWKDDGPELFTTTVYGDLIRARDAYETALTVAFGVRQPLIISGQPNGGFTKEQIQAALGASDAANS